MSASGDALPEDGAEATSFLDAGACLELLGSLYPLSVSMLFFRLEAFLREVDSVGLAGEVSIPRRLLLANLDSARDASSGRTIALEPIDADLVVECNPSGQGCTFGFAPTIRSPLTDRVSEYEGVRLRIHIQEESGISKWVSVPLQVLMAAWGDASNGFQCFANTIEFVDEDGESLEHWTYVGISHGDWMSCMDGFELEIRSGVNRRFSAAWQEYVGAARVVLHSELAKVSQTEKAALDWEESEIAKLSGAEGCLNVAPGGLAGMRLLYEKGVLAAPRVTIKEREDALAMRTHLDAPTPSPGMHHMVALAWHGDQFIKPGLASNGNTLTPAKVVELRRLFRAGETVESIATSIGATDLKVVQAAISAIGARH